MIACIPKYPLFQLITIIISFITTIIITIVIITITIRGEANSVFRTEYEYKYYSVSEMWPNMNAIHC